ncbi:hypothetical protein FB567DRAFT_61208 [Paraphoma chrysanthemicola]|uniref:Zn(2)-C6 fungal-type domain-containing protein n=1 Tax=Paraphoma chrysanthemicola TaxID=798071 RepID=A0A8K0R836_9PLEO|nr:hypothetical protein FB567DRAFT_61208 [Paraphoma chrysanthemicola]
MIERLEVKACTNCAKSRKKCGKQRPECMRCRTKHLSCHYPAAKRTQFITLCDVDNNVSIPPSTSLSHARSDSLPSTLNFTLPFLEAPTPSSWFAAPSTWIVDPPPPYLASNASRFSSSDFAYCLDCVTGWLKQWVETGSCPFIHSRLYTICFPPAIQSAYMALSTYLHKTPANSGIVCRIVEQRATELVREGLVDDPSASAGLQNVARVQALLIYQCIGLRDGDLRLRKMAEGHMPVMEEWLNLLMGQMSESLCCNPASLFTYPIPDPEQVPGSNFPTVPKSQHLWLSWILAESVRRLWLITAGVQGLYKMFTCPESTRPCMGGTLFTSRRGFWEASSAHIWEKECTVRYSGLVRLTETDKLFSMVPKGELSDFARVVLRCTYGEGWCELVGL